MFNFFKRTPRIKARLISKDIFNQEIITSKKPSLITFSASWCGACKMQKPLIHEVAHHHKDTAMIVGIVDVDNQKELSRMFAVSSIPTTIAFQGGETVFKKTGIMTRRQLEHVAQSLIQKNS